MAVRGDQRTPANYRVALGLDVWSPVPICDAFSDAGEDAHFRERYASISECRNPLPWRGRRVSAIADTTRIICRARDRRGYGRLLVERWKYRDVRAIRYRVVRIVPRH